MLIESKLQRLSRRGNEIKKRSPSVLKKKKKNPNYSIIEILGEKKKKGMRAKEAVSHMSKSTSGASRNKEQTPSSVQTMLSQN